MVTLEEHGGLPLNEQGKEPESTAEFGLRKETELVTDKIEARLNCQISRFLSRLFIEGPLYGGSEHLW